MSVATQSAVRRGANRPFSRHTPLAEVMVRDVVTIGLHERPSLADTLMKHHPIHHLPVVEHGMLCGLISQRDLYRNTLSALYLDEERDLHSFLDNFTDVASLMTPDPLTLRPTDTLGAALELMGQRRVGCIPIVDEHNTLQGILTDSDLLRILAVVLPD